jgi:hypothetical protein
LDDYCFVKWWVKLSLKKLWGFLLLKFNLNSTVCDHNRSNSKSLKVDSIWLVDSSRATITWIFNIWQYFGTIYQLSYTMPYAYVSVYGLWWWYRELFYSGHSSLPLLNVPERFWTFFRTLKLNLEIFQFFNLTFLERSRTFLNVPMNVSLDDFFEPSLKVHERLRSVPERTKKMNVPKTKNVQKRSGVDKVVIY